jgi:hypothetical protein
MATGLKTIIEFVVLALMVIAVVRFFYEAVIRA